MLTKPTREEVREIVLECLLAASPFLTAVVVVMGLALIIMVIP